MNKKSAKSVLDKEFDFSNLSVSKVPLYALLVITFVSLAISALGAFIDPSGPNYIAYALKNQNMVYCFSYNGIDHYITLAMGLIIGFYQFIFLQNKDYARAILIKGVKREKLFKEKVLLPIIAIVVIVLVVKSIVLFENFRLSTPTIQIVPAFLANTLIVIVHGIFGFTIGATSTILTGTVIEAIIGVAAIIGLPKAILHIADIAASTFLNGYSSFYSTSDEVITFIDPTRQLWETTQTYENWYSIAPPIPVNSIAHSVVWIAISVTLLFLLKRYFVKSYKYEKIGFHNSSKLITSIICFSLPVLIANAITDTLASNFFWYNNIVGIYDSAISHFDYISLFNTSLFFILFLIISLLLCLIANLIITRKIKNIKEKAPAFISICVVFLLTFIISSTGAFGYEKRMPDFDDIRSITINPPFFIVENEKEVYGYNTYSTIQADCLEQSVILTEKEDFEILEKILTTVSANNEHETNDALKIEYELKDGSVVRRNYFYLSEKASESVLTLWDTKAVKDYYRLMFFNETDFMDDNFNTYSLFYLNHLQNSQYCNLYSKNGVKTNLDKLLSDEDFTELRKALYKDITTLNSSEWFNAEKTYGLIGFTINFDDVESELSPDIVFGNQITFSVTNEMTNTLEFLKSHDLLKYFENTETNCVAYLFDVNASDSWKLISSLDLRAEFGGEIVELLSEEDYRKITSNEPLNHSTFFYTEFHSFPDESMKEELFQNLEKAEELGYATKLSETTYKDYLEKAHLKYYSGVGGNILFVYYPERETAQTFIIP